MTTTSPRTPDPELDLVIERTIDAPRELVWRAWTEPDQLMRWFTPAPWRTVACEVDLRPGGIFRTHMQSPDGKESSINLACWLEIVRHEKLVWTNALSPGFRPAPAPAVVPIITAEIVFAADGARTRYTTTVMHADPAASRRHVELGFHDGWGTVTEQLAAVAASLAGRVR